MFSIYIHEFVPFPRLHLETYLDDDCLSLKEIILSSNGYYVINSCKPINELEVVFTTTRGQLNESNSKNALFEKMLDFEEKSQLLQTLDGSIMKWWLYAEHYSGHLDKTSNEFAERQFIKPPVYPAMNVCYQPYVGEYAYAVDIASQDMLQKLSLDLVKEFDALATSAKNESASQVISNTICDHWRDFRARRFRRLNHSGLINLPYICDSDRGLFE